MFRERQAGGPDGRILSFVLCTPVSDKHQATWINYSSMIVRKYCFHGEGGKMIKVCINHDPSAAPSGRKSSLNPILGGVLFIECLLRVQLRCRIASE